MEEYTIGIVGYGVVGKGISNLFGNYVTIYDTVHYPNTKKKSFRDLDLIVICVPTPIGEDGMSCDVSNIKESLEWLEDIQCKGVVLIKSAIVPGELEELVKKHEKLRIVVSPEYMGESKYYTPFWKYPDPQDMRSHTWQIFGGHRRDTSVCVDIFKKRMSVDTVFVQTDHMTAALTKYMENCFFATKVTFCNEWFDIAKKYGVDYNELREYWLLDPRVNRNHTLVFPNERGYGGKCFPKDVKAIIADLHRKGFAAKLMRTVDAVNEEIKSKSEKGKGEKPCQEEQKKSKKKS